MKYYLGIDIGGSKINGVAVNGAFARVGNVFHTPTPKSRHALVACLLSYVESMQVKYSLNGIGIGVPGVVNKRTGRLEKTQNALFLDGWNVRESFKNLGVPIKVDNDSRCFVRAEWQKGAGRGYRAIAGLAIGTGIGGGIVIDGHMYGGATNSAGEFGHMVSNIDKIKSLKNALTFEHLGAKRAFLKYGDRNKVIGAGVANIINALNPEIVILGGGAVAEGHVRPGAVKRFAQPLIFSPRAKRTPIVSAKLGVIAQAIGATLLFK